MERFDKLLRSCGYILTAIALLYLATIIAHFDWHALALHHPVASIAYIVLFGLWAALFVVIGAYTWKLILEFINGSPVPAGDVFQVYLKSNIAKYLPGNVMHFAGRNYLGNKLGWNHSEMAFSSFLEFVFGAGFTGFIIVLFIAAGFISIPAQVRLSINTRNMIAYALMAAGGGLFLIALMYGYRYFFRKEQPGVTTRKLRDRARQFVTARFLVMAVKLFLISLVCFVMNSLFYFYLCRLVLDFYLAPADFFNAYAALGIANYSGVITPGVPGGFGVKESVSFLLISAYGYPREMLMVSILAYRVVCVLGDGIAFLFVLLFRQKSASRP